MQLTSRRWCWLPSRVACGRVVARGARRSIWAGDITLKSLITLYVIRVGDVQAAGPVACFAALLAGGRPGVGRLMVCASLVPRVLLVVATQAGLSRLRRSPRSWRPAALVGHVSQLSEAPAGSEPLGEFRCRGGIFRPFAGARRWLERWPTRAARPRTPRSAAARDQSPHASLHHNPAWNGLNKRSIGHDSGTGRTGGCSFSHKTATIVRGLDGISVAL